MIPRLTFGGVAALAAVALIAAVIFLVDRRATDRALENTERQNNAAGNESERARSAYDVCVDGGGVWNYRAGQCGGPPARSRN